MQIEINGIALDFDGVMNSLPFIWRATEEAIGTHSSLRIERSIAHVDPKSVQLLNQLIQRTSAKIFVSSTWRILHSASEIQEILNHHGFIGEVIGLTPRTFQMGDGTWSRRGNEIQAFLDEHPEIKNFIILDDESGMQHLKHRLVKTDIMVGLEQSHVDRAVAMLLEP